VREEMAMMIGAKEVNNDQGKKHEGIQTGEERWKESSPS
jgi:hypothetical protein